MHPSHLDSNRPPSSAATRRRTPSEFFGLERELWEDRKDGELARRYETLLGRTLMTVDQALDAGIDDDEQRRRLQLMSAALSTARNVMLAAASAMRQVPSSAQELRL